MGIALWRVLRGFAAAVAAILTALPAARAAEAVASEELTEVVVRATKHNESVQSVPIAITAVSGDQLREYGATDAADIAGMAPNIEVVQGIGLNSFNIRGIGSNDFQTNVDAPVAVHVDEVYLSKSFMTKMFMFDIDHVETASGPQGTLNGRNTTGGTVNFYTKAPTSTLSYGVSGSYGNYQTGRLEAFLSGPLMGDKLTGRLSMAVNHQNEGYYENPTLGETVGKDDYIAARGQLKWAGEATTTQFTAHFGRNTGSLPPYYATGIYTPASFAALNPSGGVAGMIGVSGQMVRCANYSIAPVSGADLSCVRGHDGQTEGTADPFISHGHDPHRVDNTAGGALLRIDHDLDQVRLSSLTAAEYFERHQQEVGDDSPLYTGTFIFWYSKIKQYTQELRLTSLDSSRWNYVAGLFFEHDDLATKDYLTLGSPTTAGLGGFFTDVGQKTNAAAFFANSELQATDTVKLITGFRYNWEATTINGSTCFASGIPDSWIKMPTSGCLAMLSSSDAIDGGDQRKDDNASFKIGVVWKPERANVNDREMMYYATVSTGFRSGGFNFDLSTDQPSMNQLKPEEVTSYELGFKSTLAGRTLRLNGALFYYDFRDGFIKVDRAGNPVPYLINAAGITTVGAELSTTWLPARGLTVNAGLGWLPQAKIKTDYRSDGILLDGHRPSATPRVSLNGSIGYELPLGSDLRGMFNVSGNWRSDQHLEANNKPSDFQRAYGLLNLYVGLRSDGGHWEVAAWGRNLTDTVYKTYVNDLPVFGWALSQFGTPRTYGISFRYAN